MPEIVLTAKAAVGKERIDFEFGPSQVELHISSKGNHARKLKLKTGDKVEVRIKIK